MPKHFISLKDYSTRQVLDLFAVAERLKADRAAYAHALDGKTLGMIFQKSSTRTRVSFEVGMYQMGGHALFLSGNDIQLGRGESVPDTARVLSRFVDCIMARVFAHRDILDLAKYGTVPVINGLSDLLHPCQALADYFTLRERRGDLKGLKAAWVGDGNNVAHELMYGAVKLGMRMTLAVPEGYEPDAGVVETATREAQKLGHPVPEVVRDPKKAARGADVVFTDVFTSMGQEKEKEVRLKAFAGYQVTPELMGLASKKAVFMHCLPAHRGEEVAARVIDGPQSVIFDEAENRLHVQKAVLLHLLNPKFRP